LIFGTFKNPAVQPIKAPPGKESFGIDWKPPSLRALAPYAILCKEKYFVFLLDVYIFVTYYVFIAIIVSIGNCYELTFYHPQTKVEHEGDV